MAEMCIIVPDYNAEKTLKRCVDSILAQSFTEFEALFINDGSTDGSGMLLDRYAEGDGRVRVIHTENCGAAQARKTGIENADAKYICFADADDWMERDMIGTLYGLISENEADMACCSYYLDGDEKSTPIAFEREGVSLMSGTEALLALHRQTGVMQYLWNKVFLSELLRKTELPEKYVIGEDYTIIVRILEQAKRVVQTDEPFYHYVQQEGSVSKAAFGRMHKDTYENYKEVKRWLEERHPDMRDDIDSYHICENLALIIAMGRGGKYDEKIAAEIVKEVRSRLGMFLRSKAAFKFKLSAVAAAVSYKWLVALYKLAS